jgi:hypothetical protein
MKCLNCNKEFDSLRKSAKFCSDKCRVTYSRKVSVTPSVTNVVTTSGTKTLLPNQDWLPNWKRNGYRNAKDALLKAVGDVLEAVPGATLVVGNEVFTNIKPDNFVISKARYCPKHQKVQMGKKYMCGCIVD